MAKFTFLADDNHIPEIYEADTKDALKDRFTPTALLNLTQLPDNAKVLQIFDGKSTTDRPTTSLTAEEIKRDEDAGKCTTVDEKWAFALTDHLNDAFAGNAAGLEALKKQFYADNS